MIERRLQRHLRQVAYRACWFRFWGVLFAVWAVSALVGSGILRFSGSSQQSALPWAIVLGCVSFSAAIVGIWAAFSLFEDDCEIARRIEKKHPELGASLLAAIQQRPDLPGGHFGYLQEVVINDALEHGSIHQWQETISSWRMRVLQAGHFLALAFWALTLTRMAFEGNSREAISPQLAKQGPQSQQREYQVSVEPGNFEIEKGLSLFVMARFAGALPPEASLVYQDQSQTVHRLPMSRSLDDPVFGTRIPVVNEELSYRVEFDSQRSEDYRVTVFENPELVRADAELRFPEYTRMTDKIVEDTRKITAVEGTELTLLFHLNKPVETVRLVEAEEEQADLEIVSLGNNTYSTTFTLKKTRRLRLQLEDAQGHQNKQRSEFVVQVSSNLRPEIKISSPSRDTQVSPLEELLLKVNLWDDYGLSGYGLSYNLGGQAPQELELGKTLVAKMRHEVSKSIDFEALSAKPDQLLAYHFWAEDIGPDGKLRRTLSDMYFAEVRHFEEIFRRGEQPPSGSSQQGGQNAQQATKLAELQKQIINATWKVIRRESNEKPSDQFIADTKIIQEGQESALEQAQALAEKVQDPQSKSHLAEVRRQMAEAVSVLSQSLNGSQANLLPTALAAEQAAYQALLSLRAREHLVTRGNRQSGSGSSSSGGNHNQRQLQQLELSAEENRYEQQRTASAPQNQAQHETRQISSRLRELARRQGDLNKRLKELQSALESAQSEKERAEVKQQLKRLRDQQQQILRDTDDLKNRMQSPKNQDRMADARQQLEQTRENVRRASEALKEGMVSAAAAAGTRAEKKLNKLYDDFRKQVSNRFSEDMQQMQKDAQQLEEKQHDLGQQLTDLDQARSKSLRGSGNRDRIEKGLKEQQEKLDDLLEQMRHTVEESETSEPLLSRQLYETLRKAEQSKLKDTLELTQRLLERGFVAESRETESKADRGIGRLRQGVERAAEGILGDQTEMLTKARAELEDLTKQLKKEIDRSRPAKPSDQAEGSGDGGKPRSQNTSPTPGKSSSRPSNQSASSPSSQKGNQPGAGTRRSYSPAVQSRGGGGSPGSSLEQLMTESSRSAGPITGGRFLQWSDRLRDVEEMVDDPRMQGELSAIRGRAREARLNLKRHGKEPDWEKLNDLVAQPMAEMIERITERLLQQNSEKSLVPIDRDPVPSQYVEPVRRYYERLGSGK